MLVGFLGLAAVVWWWLTAKAQEYQLAERKQVFELAALHARQKMVVELAERMNAWMSEGAARDACMAQGARWVLTRVPKAHEVGESELAVLRWVGELTRDAYAHAETLTFHGAPPPSAQGFMRDTPGDGESVDQRLPPPPTEAFAGLDPVLPQWNVPAPKAWLCECGSVNVDRDVCSRCNARKR